MDKALTRYWFNTSVGLGVGITAYSLEDAQSILAEVSKTLGIEYIIVGRVDNIDVRSLDPNHVAPNMGPVNVRGVWFPCLNLFSN